MLNRSIKFTHDAPVTGSHHLNGSLAMAAKVFRFLIDLPKKFFLFMIHFYRIALSPLKNPCCKYYPTCSAYAYEAISIHGVFKGSAMAVWRLLRCNPFSKGGYDPVKPRKVPNKES